MAEETSGNREEMIKRLKEMVLDHLGIPRPGTAKHVQELQDRLLPLFIERSRNAWLAASPMPLPNNQSLWSYLVGQTQQAPTDIDRLNQILQDMGIHDLLDEIADSPDVKAMADMPVDPYEERILKAAGHPNASSSMRQLLAAVATDPKILANSEKKLKQANEAALRAHRDIYIVINPPASSPASVPPATPTPAAAIPPEKPRRRKIFTGLGKLFSGLALLSGNAIVAPTVVMGLTALPVIGSLAGGVAAVAEGVGQLLREGE